ncbi:hypothetical protein Csa_014835 [Cucumis sativus]|uniref:Uncharacterized protein n=1 Tax=Cucumis sativus TaxID=3659 RepID=A0A0A0KVN8_CUCSA|nr:hypothetical protein Csa_014835 [Cucumis sativus]
MKNPNNNPTNQQQDPDQNPAYLTHDLDHPIGSYASPSLYDFNPGITSPVFRKDS